MRNLVSVSSITMEITHRCNRGCDYCFNNSNEHSKEELSLSAIRSLIDSANLLQIPSLYISGGEPLMHANAVEVLEMLSSYYGEKTIITTGGSHFTDRIISLIIKNNINVITTLDSPTSEIHDARRGYPCFEEIIKGVNQLLSQNWHDKYTIRFNLSYDNESLLMDMFDFCENMGINKLVIGILLNLGRAKNKKYISIEEDYEKIKNIQNLILRLPLESNRKIVVNMDVNMPVACPYDKILYGGSISPNINVTPTGEVFSCSMMCDNQYSLGNVNSDKLENIVQDEIFLSLIQVLKNGLKQKNSCIKCNFSHLCHGGCPAYSLAKFGILEAEDNMCELRKSFISSTLKKMPFDSIKSIAESIAGL